MHHNRSTAVSELYQQLQQYSMTNTTVIGILFTSSIHFRQITFSSDTSFPLPRDPRCGRGDTNFLPPTTAHGTDGGWETAHSTDGQWTAALLLRVSAALAAPLLRLSATVFKWSIHICTLFGDSNTSLTKSLTLNVEGKIPCSLLSLTEVVPLVMMS